MKTLEDLYNELLSSDALKLELAARARDEHALAGWLKANGCAATVDELWTYIKDNAPAGRELSEGEMEAVVGGALEDESVLSWVQNGLPRNPSTYDLSACIREMAILSHKLNGIRDFASFIADGGCD